MNHKQSNELCMEYCLLTCLLTHSLTHSLHGAENYLKSWLSHRLSKNILSLWNPKVHHRVHKSPPLDPTLSQLKPVHPIDPYLPKVQLKVIPSTKSHVLFPLLMSCQRIGPGPRRFETFRNKLFFLRWGIVRPTPNLQAGGPPLAGCSWLFIQYIRSYSLYLEAFPPSATWGRAMPW
jgi:hypothetical protein